MAEQSKMNVESLRRSVGKKLGIEREAFDKVVAAKRDLVKKNNPKLDEAGVEKRVFLLVKSEYKKQLMSPAMNFEGVVVSVGRTFDTAARMRADAMEAVKKGEEQAIAEGYVDIDGYPLDMREVYGSGQPNRQYGKRLPKHNYIRNLVGVCMHEEVPKLFRLVLSDVVSAEKPADPSVVLKTDLKVPMFVPVEFRANVAKTQRDDRFLQLNQSKSTDFKLGDADIDIANVMASDLLNPFRVTPEEVGEYYDAHATQPERLVVMEGSVMMIGEEAGVSGDVLVMMDSEESGFDFMGVRCWVPEYISKEDLYEGDVVTVMGQANRGKFGDEEVDMVNVTGIYMK